MKRPLILAVLPLAAGLLSARTGFLSVLFFLCLVALFPLNKTVYTKQLRLLGFLGLFVGFILFALRIDGYTELKDQWSETLNQQGQGIIKDMNDHDWGCVYSLNPWWDAYGQRHDYAIEVLADKGAGIGDRVKFIGSKSQSKWLANDGSFDLPAYLFAQQTVGRVKGLVIVLERRERYGFHRQTYEWRLAHGKLIEAYMPSPESDVVKALVIGVNDLGDGYMEAFSQAGLMHLLAISGMHVGLVASALFRLLKGWVPSLRLRAAVITVLMVVYCIYTGSSVSTVRATVMVTVFLGHHMLLRKYDQHIAIVLALGLILVADPTQMVSMGFQFSFGAVMGIFYITPVLKNKYNSEGHWFIDGLIMMLGIYLATGPLMAYYSGTLPLYGFLANLLALPVIMLLMGCAAAGLMITTLTGLPADWLMHAAFFLARYLIQTALWVQSLPGSVLVVGRPHWSVSTGYYIVLLLILLNQKKTVLICTLAFAVMISYNWYLRKDDLTVTMLDVGNGDALVIEKEGRCILIDGGGIIGMEEGNTGKKVIEPYLMIRGVRKIDRIILSHSDFDHICGIIELMDRMTIGAIDLPTVYKTYEDPLIMALKDKAEDNNIPIHYAEAGTTISLADIHLEWLYPFDDIVQKDNNRHSAFVVLSEDDFSMIFTGDATVDEEMAVLEKYGERLMEIDVLKVAHHGSLTSSAEGFLTTVEPKLSLISVSANNPYGHPHYKVLNRLESIDSRIMTTGDWGQIRLTYRHGKLTVDTYLEERRK